MDLADLKVDEIMGDGGGDCVDRRIEHPDDR